MSATRFLFPSAVAALLLMGCQSAEDRQAAELREFLRGNVQEIEALNTKVIAEFEAYLQEQKASGRASGVAGVQTELERVQVALPAELNTLRQKIEDYPNLELRMLSREVQRTIDNRMFRIKGLEQTREDSRRFDELRPHLKEWGKNLNESILGDAREGPAWLRRSPRKKDEK